MGTSYLVIGSDGTKEIVDEDDLVGDFNWAAAMVASQQNAAHFFSQLNGLMQQRGDIISQAARSGVISNDDFQQFSQGLQQLQALAALTQQNAMSPTWATDFWRGLPPLGTNYGGQFGAAINANASSIMALVNQARQQQNTTAVARARQALRITAAEQRHRRVGRTGAPRGFVNRMFQFFGRK